MTKQYDIEDDRPNTYGRDEITCPFCGYEHGDSWENSSDDGKQECEGCGKSFSWTREVSVSYNSYPIKNNTQKS